MAPKKDYSLSYTSSKQWEDVQLHWVGKLSKGQHTVAIRGSQANMWGCGANWGDIDVLVVPVRVGLGMDECLKNNGGCHAKRKCVHSAGSTKCENCAAGYVNDGAKGCKDVNECAVKNGGCHATRKCTNTVGGMTCGKCAAGYAND